MIHPPPTTTLFPYTTLFRSSKEKNDTSNQYVKETFDVLQRLEKKPYFDPSAKVQVNSLKSRALIQQKNRVRSEEHTSELQSHSDLVCRLLLEKKKTNNEIAK